MGWDLPGMLPGWGFADGMDAAVLRIPGILAGIVGIVAMIPIYDRPMNSAIVALS